MSKLRQLVIDMIGCREATDAAITDEDVEIVGHDFYLFGAKISK